jgi:ligand-binding SRPBCC domain-containing protein
MREYVLERRQTVPVPLADAFAFFADAQNLERITPAWLRFRIVHAADDVTAGSILVYRLQLFGLPIHWVTRIAEWRPPRSFTDVQLTGPYRLWEHTHRLTPVPGGTEIYDHVRYRLPGGPLAPLIQLIVARWLRMIFDYRAERTRGILATR